MRLILFSVFAIAVIISSPVLADKPDDGWFDFRDIPCNGTDCDNFIIPLDESWDVVRMDGAGGNGEADPNDPCQRNDDDFSLAFPLPFVFDLYGTLQTEIYINNNGNISFGGGFWEYTPEGFPIAGYPMVAPFWADVDTRTSSPASSVVYVKAGVNWLALTWDHVGYYNSHDDLLNTFQVVISDGTYEPIGIGNNICFAYCDMQWTTGDASGGSGGFGGEPATVGANKGDGTDYFLIGRFNLDDASYDGPGGNPDGVHWLDGQRFCFSVAEEFNTPPVPIDFPPNDSICVAVGEVLQLQVGFIGPEGDQTVHTDVFDGGLANFSWTSTDGNPSVVDMEFTPAQDQIGNHIIHFEATDDGNPPETTEKDLVLCVTAPVPTVDTTLGRIKTLYR